MAVKAKTKKPEKIIETTVCTQCNQKFKTDETFYLNDEPYCESCREEYITTCERCGESIRIDDAIRDDYTCLCNGCFEHHYMRCVDCNCILHRDSAYYSGRNEDYYCEDCYDNLSDEEDDVYLHEYGYKPTPIFYGEASSRYFGVELEIDKGGKLSSNAEKLIRSVNANDDLIYIKTDGSLDDGMEIVTHPMTLEYHKSKMPWLKLVKVAVDLGYKSHKTTTCGLHIHVDRLSFGDDVVKQDSCTGRILFIVERFWQELLRFSRRTEAQVNQWAKRYGYKDKPAEILENAKKGYSGRNACVNITNYHTIEFRLFRGTLKLNTIIAALQMVNEICNAAVFMSDEEVSALNWCGFIESINKEKNPELVTYLKECRLYINEPVEYEEDA